MISYTSLFLIIYFVYNIFLSYKIYKHTRSYFKPIITDEPKTGTTFNLHEKYVEFSRKDNVSYLRILFGMIILFWIRFIGLILLSISFYIILKILFRNVNNHDAVYRRRLKFFSTLHARIAFFIFGIRRTIYTPEVNEVYCKYLGPNYDFDESEYSCIITNHMSWYEIIYLVFEESPGFIAKHSIKSVPLIGYIALKLDSMFLDRTCINDRSNIVGFINF
jgi:hypothetical protein